MDRFILWPGQPALSWLLLWLASSIFLWAAREPMQGLLSSLGASLEEALRALARRAGSAARALGARTRALLLATGRLEAQAKIERELGRVDGAFSDQLGRYDRLHRHLDDLLARLDADYQSCGNTPPEVPGWSSAVEAVAQIPSPGDAHVQKVLDSIRKSSKEAEKKALDAYRDDTARRHKALAGMTASWKSVRGLMARMYDAVGKAQDSTTRIHGYVEQYERIRTGQEEEARALSYSAVKLFAVSALVLAVAFGGAFINFQLISLPMAELVPAGARVGGIPVAAVSALVIVLMETALGIFLMDMLGITDLFPKLQGIPHSRRRLILGLALGGLFFLAAVESSLAVLREQIVEADAALKLSLAGSEVAAVVEASNSSIPVVGQAVLGFVLPWVLAMVAIPLELLFDSARHVLAAAAVLVLHGVEQLALVLAHAMQMLTRALVQLYDAYVAIPLRIERSLRGGGSAGGGGRGAVRPQAAEAPQEGVA